MSEKQRRLRNLLIEPKFQLRFILVFVLSVIALSAINAFVFFHYVKENYDILVLLSPMDDEVKLQLHKELIGILIRLTLFSAGFVLFAGFVALFFSHKTAGPLYQLQEVIRRIKKGERQARVKFREGDEFQSLGKEFNEMLDTISRST